MMTFTDGLRYYSSIMCTNCGYVIMPNHLHVLVYTLYKEKTIDKIIGNGKRFMAYEIVKRLRESGRKELLGQMSRAVLLSSRKKNSCSQTFILLA